MSQKFKSILFFPSQHWNHTRERQHEIGEFLSRKYENIYVFNPLGLIKYKIYRINFIKKVISYLSNLNEKKQENYQNLNFEKKIFIPIQSKFIGYLNYKLINNKRYNLKESLTILTYVNYTNFEFYKRSRYKVIDLAERRKKNEYLSKEMLKLEEDAIKIADLIVIDNKATIKDYLHLNSKIFYIPQGVDQTIFYNNFSERKYIGYIGNMHNSIDYKFLDKFIQNNTNQKFIFIGKILDENFNNILNYKNVKHIDQISKENLNYYLNKMKLGLIPYLKNEFTEGVFPTKLFEYLASGTKVLSTSIPEVKQYESKDIIEISDNPFIKIDFSFDDEKAKDLVKINTWESRFEEYYKLLDQL